MIPNDGKVPYGTRVRLLYNFARKDEVLDLVRDGKLEGLSAPENMSPKTFIQQGEEGTVQEGPYSSGIYDYSKEIPVQFDMFSKGKGVEGYDKEFTIGVPREILEIIGAKRQ